ncbi:hypothetical protein K456DRAFT_1538384 [Colletotrichum gloeosporioides 23]|nr:hypothetical protein K456DRAFT_1538384 [Colletotrichum gloeosporioides 23]
MRRAAFALLCFALLCCCFGCSSASRLLILCCYGRFASGIRLAVVLGVQRGAVPAACLSAWSGERSEREAMLCCKPRTVNPKISFSCSFGAGRDQDATARRIVVEAIVALSAVALHCSQLWACVACVCLPPWPRRPAVG